MNLARAQHLLDVAQAHASQIGVPMALAVVDAGGHPIAARRMDGASLIAGATVIAKARTAVFFNRSTGEVLDSARRHPQVYQSLLAASHPPLVCSKGGLVIRDNTGKVVGAIAASGGSGDQDEAVSQAALQSDQL